MDLQLSGKRALVTGGNRGIGLAIARGLLREGAHVVIAARDRSALDDAATALASETGGKVGVVCVDTRDDASVDALVVEAVALLGGLDIVVNAAAQPGFAGAPGIAGLDSARLMEEINTKVIGYMRVARAAAPHLIAGGWGRIINISGLAARQARSIPNSVRNIAVAAMTKGLADELGPKGVNVTVVHPGMTRTERTPDLIARHAAANGITAQEAEKGFAAGTLIGRLVSAEEVADVVAFLASPRSIAINGDAIAAGGGTPVAIHY